MSHRDAEYKKKTKTKIQKSKWMIHYDQLKLCLVALVLHDEQPILSISESMETVLLISNFEISWKLKKDEMISIRQLFWVYY